MAETKTYTVTKLAGPKVAGRAVSHGQELELTEAQAASELLSGAIVEKAQNGDAKAKDRDPKAADPFAGSNKLKDIQARALGLDKAPAEPAQADEAKPAEPAKADTPPAKPAVAGGKAAARADASAT